MTYNPNPHLARMKTLRRAELRLRLLNLSALLLLGLTVYVGCSR